VSAVFLGSFVASHDLPQQNEPRIAFLGRSNVGKSALINLLTGSKIARISKTPGRTQTLNLYLVDEKRIFGDFPGYGFAKVSKQQKKIFDALVRKFLNRESFECAVQIVDSRHPDMESDLQLQRWLHASGLPSVIVLNKSDKLNQSERVKAQRHAEQLFAGHPWIFASTVTQEGKQELEKLLEQMMPEHRAKRNVRTE
jgi:GTP-binding protein